MNEPTVSTYALACDDPTTCGPDHTGTHTLTIDKENTVDMTLPTIEPGNCGHHHDTTAEHAACYFNVTIEQVGAWAGCPGGPWAVRYCDYRPTPTSVRRAPGPDTVVMLCPDAEYAYELGINSDEYGCGNCTVVQVGSNLHVVPVTHRIVQLPDCPRVWPDGMGHTVLARGH